MELLVGVKHARIGPIDTDEVQVIDAISVTPRVRDMPAVWRDARPEGVITAEVGEAPVVSAVEILNRDIARD